MKRMMMALLLVLVLMSGGCTPPHVSVMAKPDDSVLDSFLAEIALAHNRFGFDVYKALAEPEKNVMVSPVSLSMAFAMALNGSDGETEAEMARIMGLDGWDRRQINQNLLGLLYFLRTADPEVILEIANSAWLKEGVPFEETYMEEIREYLLAESDVLDFQNPEAAAVINNWVNKNTRGLIPKVVEPPINPLTILFLVNTVYFDGNWTAPFNRNHTSDQIFTSLDGKKHTVPMMTQSEVFPYYENDQFQIIRLAYGKEKRMGMYILLPQENQSWDGVQEQWSQEAWNSLKPRLQEKLGTVFLPRFDFSFETGLVETMKSLGMTRAFDATAADFSRMVSPSVHDDVHISSVIHKTRIRVNEEGTEAAAVTSIEVGVTSMPQYEFEMKMDRPFLFVIEDSETGAILFLGHMTEPGA